MCWGLNSHWVPCGKNGHPLKFIYPCRISKKIGDWPSPNPGSPDSWRIASTSSSLMPCTHQGLRNTTQAGQVANICQKFQEDICLITFSCQLHLLKPPVVQELFGAQISIADTSSRVPRLASQGFL